MITNLKDKIPHGNDKFNFDVYNVNIQVGAQYLYTHWHSEFEIIYVKSGVLVLEIEGNSYKIEENEAVIVDRYKIHSGRELAKEDCSFCAILFGEELLYGSVNNIVHDKYVKPLLLGEKMFPVHIDTKKSYHNEIIHCIKEINNFFQEKSTGYEVFVTINLLTILYIIIKNDAFLDVDSKNSRMSCKIKEVIQFIYDNYSEPINIKEISQNISLSNEYFIRIFKQYTGKTPMQFIINHRVSAAKKLLKKTDSKISDIAMQCGFNNISNFNKCFKKVEGISPEEYRKE